MNIILVALFFLLAVSITLSRGAGAAFALVYLPALLLLSQVRELPLPWLTDANPPGAAIYGILLASVAAGRRLRLRLTAVDYVVGLLVVAYAVSALTTVRPYRAMSVIGGMGLNLGFLPYFVVRVSLQNRVPPRRALELLVGASLIICIFALIEFRLWPETYQDFLRWFGLMDQPSYRDSMRRFSFLRASASFEHPIDLGIGGALLFALIAMSAWRRGLSLRTPWVRGGLALALVASFCGISFGAFCGLGCGLLIYFILVRLPTTRRLIRVAVASFIILGFSFSSYLAMSPIPDSAPADGSFTASLRNRQQLIQNSWYYAKSAGLFGFGDVLPEETVQGRAFGSVDNAYLLITMSRGWIALGLWLLLPISLAVLVSRAVRRSRSTRQTQLILAGFSAVIGTMVAMFTVWFGFLYPSLFMIVLALTVNESQAAIQGSPNRAGRDPMRNGRKPVHPAGTRPATARSLLGARTGSG